MAAATRDMCVALAMSLGRPASVAQALPLAAASRKVRAVLSSVDSRTGCNNADGITPPAISFASLAKALQPQCDVAQVQG